MLFYWNSENLILVPFAFGPVVISMSSGAAITVISFAAFVVDQPTDVTFLLSKGLEGDLSLIRIKSLH